MSLEPLVTSIVTLASVGLGAFGTYLVAGRQSRSDTQIALEQIASQSQLAREQAIDEVELERERHRRDRLEEAYTQLMIWCASLDATIDELWCACCDGEPDEVKRAYKIAGDWPFTVLKESKEAAGYRHYWSEEVHALLNEFRGKSSKFSPSVHAILHARVTGVPLEKKSEDFHKEEIWESRLELGSVLEQIRRLAHDEVFAGVRESKASSRREIWG